MSVDYYKMRCYKKFFFQIYYILRPLYSMG